MLSFTYRCPRTGQIVHGHVADDLISGSETYEPVTCTACGGIHLINHKTGKLLEELRTASPPLNYAHEPILTDVVFTDKSGDQHLVPSQFTYGPAKPASLWSRWFRR
jgi:hypothetical protein